MSFMPSPPHDALVSMFRDRPQLAVEILRDLIGKQLPETPLVRVEPNTFNTRPSDDFDADLVLSMGPPQSPAHAIVVEIQQDTSKDPRKLARYAASLWLMMHCDATVLVVCPNRATAVHYMRPVDSGLTGYRLHPCVLGPDSIPAITDAKEATAHLDLATMSVMVHGRNRKVIEAFATALADTADDHAPQYYEYAYSMSAPEIRQLLEEIMTSTTWPVYSPFAREHFGRGKDEGREEGREEGKAEEAAKLVILVLTARGFTLPDQTHTQITTCKDLNQLETWATKAATIQTLDELFA
ncbi:hypothetical protein [Nonomuraea sp. NPDC003214]